MKNGMVLEERVADISYYYETNGESTHICERRWYYTFSQKCRCRSIDKFKLLDHGMYTIV